MRASPRLPRTKSTHTPSLLQRIKSSRTANVGVKNADILCKPIIDRNSDITPQTLSLSLSRSEGPA